MDQEIKENFDNLKQDVSGLKQEIEDLAIVVKNSFDRIEEKMVTKDDLCDLESRMRRDFRLDMNKMKLELIDTMDEKISRFKGDLVILMRGEDRKIVRVVEMLKQKKVFTDEDAKMIFQMEPFPQLIV